VYFRRYTYERAIQLGVTGWVKNLADGRVEVFICGEQVQVEALRDWLWEGSPAAKVSGVEVRESPLEDYAEFEVR
jgi:acylphosphatase